MMEVERCSHRGTPMSGPIDDMIVGGTKVLGYKTRCTRSDSEIKVGDEMTQRTPTQQYHEACYDDMVHRPEKGGKWKQEGSM